VAVSTAGDFAYDDTMLKLTLPTPRILMLAGAAVLVVAALGAGGWYWHTVSQRHALAAYADALTRAQPALGPQATADARAAGIRDLEAALTQYPSGPGAGQVAYELGNLRFDAQQYGQARGAWELALAQGAPRTLKTLSEGGVAYTWEAERNYGKAVDAFKVALTGLGPKDFYYEELLIGLGRTQELSGQKADAIATYRRALGELAQSRRLEEIKARLAALGA
jgi:tetratricopeptide (TPR) repeat protein